PAVGHLLPSPKARRAALRRSWFDSGGGHHCGHHRSHEAHEHGARRRTWARHRDSGSRRHARRIWRDSAAYRQVGLTVSIRRILIANRGEIATRVIRTCRALGIETVLAASEADRDSLPARLADRTVCIGPARPSESYLKVETIVQAALGTRADAIHPGYGFLSERAALARLCEEQGVVFIGPTAEQIDAVGDKLRARAAAEAAEVPVVPGGAVESVSEALSLGESVGAPLLVKAVGGGGGRGMKRVDRLSDLPAAMELASSEAGAAFGDARVYLERFVASGRHVEVQVLGDGAGRVIHLGERDCSVQRRYQK